jgi:hypothetical protein
MRETDEREGAFHGTTSRTSSAAMLIGGGRHTARAIGLASLSDSCSGRSATAADTSQKVAPCNVTETSPRGGPALAHTLDTPHCFRLCLSPARARTSCCLHPRMCAEASFRLHRPIRWESHSRVLSFRMERTRHPFSCTDARSLIQPASMNKHNRLSSRNATSFQMLRQRLVYCISCVGIVPLSAAQRKAGVRSIKKVLRHRSLLCANA